MIPQFPEFKNLELSDKDEIENITKQFPPHSDFHFISIFCWDIDNTTQISILNENLVIKQIDCFTGEKFYSFIGTNTVTKTVKEISNFQDHNCLPLILRWIPEETFNCLDGVRATVTEDRDYFDYIYNVSEFHYALGSKYKNFRRILARFNRDYPFITSSLLDLTNSDIQSQINSLFKTWSENKLLQDKECEPEFEEMALNKLLSSSTVFHNFLAIGIFNNAELIAFTINDLMESEYGCLLFWKANTKYAGIYTFAWKETIKLYQDKGLELLNFESDIGIESLRESKLRYKPSFFLKKYKIEINN